MKNRKDNKATPATNVPLKPVEDPSSRHYYIYIRDNNSLNELKQKETKLMQYTESIRPTEDPLKKFIIFKNRRRFSKTKQHLAAYTTKVEIDLGDKRLKHGFYSELYNKIKKNATDPIFEVKLTEEQLKEQEEAVSSASTKVSPTPYGEGQNQNCPYCGQHFPLTLPPDTLPKSKPIFLPILPKRETNYTTTLFLSEDLSKVEGRGYKKVCVEPPRELSINKK